MIEFRDLFVTVSAIILPLLIVLGVTLYQIAVKYGYQPILGFRLGWIYKRLAHNVFCYF